jgi:hypothetical protein
MYFPASSHRYGKPTRNIIIGHVPNRKPFVFYIHHSYILLCWTGIQSATAIIKGWSQPFWGGKNGGLDESPDMNRTHLMALITFCNHGMFNPVEQGI